MDQGVKRTQRDYSLTLSWPWSIRSKRCSMPYRCEASAKRKPRPLAWPPRHFLGKAQKRKARQRQHFPAMRWQGCACPHEHPRPARGTAATATRLLILTGARAQMVRFATQDEFEAAGLIAVNPLPTPWDRFRSFVTDNNRTQSSH